MKQEAKIYKFQIHTDNNYYRDVSGNVSTVLNVQDDEVYEQKLYFRVSKKKDLDYARIPNQTDDH